MVLFVPLILSAATKPEDLAELFMPAEFSAPQLSPDGACLGFWARRGDTTAIGILNFATHHTDYYAGDAKLMPIGFWWKDRRRLLVETLTYEKSKAGYLTYDVDNKTTVDLEPMKQVWGRLFDALPDDPDHIIMGSRSEVVKVDLRNFHEEKVSGFMPGAGSWILDRHGVPRAAFDYDDRFGLTRLWWRKSPEASWDSRAFTIKEKQFFPQALADDNRHLLGWEFAPDMHVALSRLDTASGKIEPVDGLPELEPMGLVQLAHSNRPVAVMYNHEPHPELVALTESLAPGLGRMEKQFSDSTVRLLDIMPDGKNWLLWIGNSRQPGTYVIFNAETAAFVGLARAYGKTLSEDRLAPAEFFTFQVPEDQRRGSGRLWRPANRAHPPLIVFCPATLAGEVSQDIYQQDVQAFVRQGFAVLRLNEPNFWRSSRASQSVAEENLTTAIQQELEAAVRELGAQQIVDASRVTLFGKGMAGVLALQVAAHSRSFAAVATINIPAEVHRDDLFSLASEVGSNRLIGKMGGWFASEKAAAALSPVRVAPTLSIPALYLHDEVPGKGQPTEAGRDIREALKNSKAVAQSDFAHHWSEFLKLPSRAAREEAEISIRIATFFDQTAPRAVP